MSSVSHSGRSASRAGAQTQSLTPEQQKIAAEALKIADWIGHDRYTGAATLAVNQRKLEELIQANPWLKASHGKRLEELKSPESRIRHRAGQLAHYISYDRSRTDISEPKKRELIERNETQLQALLEKHLDYLNSNPKFAASLARDIERGRSSVHKEAAVKTQVGTATLPTELENQTRDLAEKIGFARAKGDQAALAKVQEELSGLRQKHAQFFNQYKDTDVLRIYDASVRVAEESGAKRWKDAFRDATAIHNSGHFVGTDKQTIFSILERKKDESQTEYQTRIETLKEAYQTNYKRSLEGHLRYYLTGDSEERAASLLSNDKLRARFFQLKEARGVLSDDTQAIKDAYKGLSKEEITELNTRINAEWQQKYGKSYNYGLGRSASITYHDFRAIEAAQRGDEIGVAAHNLREAQLSLFSKSDAVNTVLEANRDRMLELKGAYARAIHNSNDSDRAKKDLERALPDGDGKERAKANLDGNFDKADAYHLREAFDGGIWGTDHKEIEKVLDGTTAVKRRGIEAAYTEISKGETNALRSRIGQLADVHEQRETLHLLDTGALTREMRFARATRGLTTDEEGVKKALAGMSKSEAEEFKRRFRETYGEDALAVARAELDSDDLFDAEENLRGAPTTAAEAAARMEARIRHERSGLLSGIMDWMDPESRSVMDEQLRRAQELALRQDASDAETRDVQEMFGVAADSYRRSKASVAETTANSAALIVAGAVTVAMPPAAPVVFTMATVAGASLTARAAAKYLIKGDGYGLEEFALDAGNSAAEGVAFGAGTRLARYGAARVTPQETKQVVEEVLEEIGDGMTSGLIQGALTEKWRDDPSGALRDMFSSTLLGGLGGGAGAFGGQKLTRRLHQNVQTDIDRAVTDIWKRFDEARLAGELTEQEAELLVQRTTPEIEATVARISNRFSTQLALQTTQAATGGAISGVLNTFTELPEDGSFSDNVKLLLWGALSGARDSAIGGAASGLTQRALRPAIDVGLGQEDQAIATVEQNIPQPTRVTDEFTIEGRGVVRRRADGAVELERNGQNDRAPRLNDLRLPERNLPVGGAADDNTASQLRSGAMAADDEGSVANLLRTLVPQFDPDLRERVTSRLRTEGFIPFTDGEVAHRNGRDEFYFHPERRILIQIIDSAVASEYGTQAGAGVRQITTPDGERQLVYGMSFAVPSPSTIVESLRKAQASGLIGQVVPFIATQTPELHREALDHELTHIDDFEAGTPWGAAKITHQIFTDAEGEFDVPDSMAAIFQPEPPSLLTLQASDLLLELNAFSRNRTSVPELAVVAATSKREILAALRTQDAARIRNALGVWHQQLGTRAFDVGGPDAIDLATTMVLGFHATNPEYFDRAWRSPRLADDDFAVRGRDRVIRDRSREVRREPTESLLTPEQSLPRRRNDGGAGDNTGLALRDVDTSGLTSITSMSARDRIANIKEAIARGELPEFLSETFRLVPLDSEAGLAFQREMTEFVRKYCPKHYYDIDAKPLRFILSADDSPNAAYLKGSEPPTIIVNVGFFKERRLVGGKRGVPAVTVEDLAVIILHEIAHIVVRETQGEINSSKFEEGYCYARPVQLMHEMKLDPLAAVDFAERLWLKTFARESGHELAQLLDEHPHPDNTVKIFETAAAAVGFQRGALIERLPSQGKLEGTPLLQAILSAQHTSWLDTWRAETQWDSKPQLEQLHLLRDLINTSVGDYEIRVRDIASLIRSMKLRKSSPPEVKAFNEMVDTILDFIGADERLELGVTLYRAASAVWAPVPELVPLGRLNKVSNASRSIVDLTISGKAESQIVEASRQLLVATENEPLYTSDHGRSFLRQIQWPTFPWPEIDDELYDRLTSGCAVSDDSMDRRSTRARRGSAWDYDEETDSRTSLPQAEWRPFVELGQKHPDVLKAALLMGFWRDSAFADALHTQPALMMEMFESGYEYSPRLGHPAEISHGPVDGKLTPASVQIADGKIVRIFSEEVSGQDADRAALQKRASAVLAYTERLLGKDTLTDVERHHLEIGVRILGAAGQDRSDQESDSSKVRIRSYLILLEHLERHFDLVTAANMDALLLDSHAQSTYLSQVRTLLSKDRDRYALQLRDQIFGLHTAKGKSPFATSFHMTAVAKRDYLAPLTMPFSQFVLNNEEQLFTPQERFALFDRAWTGIQIQYHMPGSATTETLDTYFSVFAPLAQEAEVLPPTLHTVSQILQAYESTESALARNILEFKLLSMLGRKSYSLEVVGQVLRTIGPDRVSDFVNYTSANRDRFTRIFAEKVESTEIAAAVSSWNTLAAAHLFQPKRELELLVPLVDRIAAESDADVRASLALKLMQGRGVHDPSVRTRLTAIWSHAVHELHGTDDGSAAYRATIGSILDQVERSISKLNQHEMLASLAAEIQSQAELSKDIKRVLAQLSPSEKGEAHLAGVMAEGSLDQIRRSPRLRKETLDYLTRPPTRQSIDQFVEEVGESFHDEVVALLGGEYYDDEEVRSKVDKQKDSFVKQFKTGKAKLIYKNFWAAPLEGRAAIARELFADPKSKTPFSDTTLLDETLEKLIPGTEDESVQAREIVATYIRALHPLQRDLMLAALMTGARRSVGSEVRIGASLAVVLESLGPAETKVGQNAASHPNVPQEIRTDLQRLKHHASEPDRLDIMDWVEVNAENIIADYKQRTGAQGDISIARIGRVVGSGSIFVAVEIELSDGTSHILALRRPYARDRANAGFITLQRMVDSLPADHPAKATLKELLEISRERITIETDCSKAAEQYGIGARIYNGKSVVVDGERFEFFASEVVSQGETVDRDGREFGFFMMSKVPGDHFIEMPTANDEDLFHKKRTAQAVLTVELNNVLNGVFDSDRHGAQLKIRSNRIGHFDFKGTALAQWSEEGYRQLATVLTNALGAAASGANLSETLMSEQQKLRDAGQEVDPLVTEVHKAILALGDYANVLNGDELKRVLLSAISNGIHPSLQSAFLAQASPFVRLVLQNWLTTGQLPPLVTQFLGLNIRNEDLIRIARN